MVTAGTGQGDALTMPLVTSLALVALAAWGVLLVTRRVVRRCAAVLALLASLGLLVASAAALGDLRATVEDVERILVQRSVYHLKEADPQCFLLPRLRPAAKAALTELQYDELGDGEPDLVHQHLFAQALEAAGLDPGYGAYVDDADEETLTLNNAISLLCLNRRLVHAALGHLAAFEATSALPSADMVRGLQRLGFAEPVWRYYDEHVEADAVHEHLARRICDLATEGDPALEREVLFGAFVCVDLEDRCAERLVPTAVPT